MITVEVEGCLKATVRHLAQRDSLAAGCAPLKTSWCRIRLRLTLHRVHIPSGVWNLRCSPRFEAHLTERASTMKSGPQGKGNKRGKHLEAGWNFNDRTNEY